MSDLSGMIGDAMKDPRFADILSSLKEKADSGELDVNALLSDLTKDGAKDADAPSAPAAKAVGMDSHKKLLSALKPYLTDQKRSAVDGILRIGEFSGVIEALSKKNGGGR